MALRAICQFRWVSQSRYAFAKRRKVVASCRQSKVDWSSGQGKLHSHKWEGLTLQKISMFVSLVMLYSDLLWLKNKKNPWRISRSPVIAAQSVLKPRPYLFFGSKRIALFPDVIAFPKEWSEQYMGWSFHITFLTSCKSKEWNKRKCGNYYGMCNVPEPVNRFFIFFTIVRINSKVIAQFC